MQNKYWEKFYTENKVLKQSSFAEFIFILNFLKHKVLELGCGNGRDLIFFRRKKINARGIDNAYQNNYFIKKTDVAEYIKLNSCNEDVYTRFFWHAIERPLQLKILKWVKHKIFIEARTTEDKPTLYKKHKRNFVNVSQLVKDLKNNNFEILYLKEGYGMSKYKNEDPHLVRIIATKK